MAAASNKKPDFQKLKDEWYKKLEDDGFVDIEQDEYSLKSWSSKFRINLATMPKEVWIAKVTYYQMADNFLQEYKFSSELEKAIWEYHANGISVRDIATTIKALGVKKTQKDNVWKIIKALKAKMYTMYVTAENGNEYRE